MARRPNDRCHLFQRRSVDQRDPAAASNIRVTLAQKGLSETLNGAEDFMESLASRPIDELNLQWQQKISPHTLNSDIDQDTSRKEPRLFTYVDGDELPQQLKIRTNPQSVEATGTRTGYEPYDGRDELVICRVTLLNDRSIIFEPRLSHNGYRIQSKIGEYLAMVHVWDDHFTPIYDQLEVMTLAPPIPETQSFELPQEDVTQFVSLMNIDYASDFDYKTICIEYVAYFPEGTTCTSNNTEGQTSQCSADENSLFHFSIPIEFNFVAPKISTFHLRFRVRSEDYWGRQYVAGYASLIPLLSPGRTDYRVECWRPIRVGDNASELQELFIGQSIDIDFLNWKEDGVISRAGLTTQSSGTLHISITNIVQRRDYMTRETLNHMKYGAMFGRMGMRSDLYWRIMKVLMEFEEAKRQLLNVRANQ
ncbi:hypothetical protein RB195_003515 [Necator americanus]|uniref:Meckel syndrome type 1 protein n=1 Tax=Necator americanus TaxID=51031 RepID=A0ABR1DNY1_NECAM